MKDEYKILVVDDSYTNNLLVQDILEDCGYTVFVANSASEALTQLADNKDMDLIILDIMMPEMDGYELLEILKKSKQYKQIPIFVVSARVKVEDIDRAMELGAFDYINKPLMIDEFKGKIQRLFEIKN